MRRERKKNRWKNGNRRQRYVEKGEEEKEKDE